MKVHVIFLVLCIYFLPLFQFVHSSHPIVKARLESCPGCSLNRLTEIKSFAYDDLPKYGIEFKKIHGAPPVLIFLDLDDKEVERHSLSTLSRDECNQLLLTRGFKHQQNVEL